MSRAPAGSPVAPTRWREGWRRRGAAAGDRERRDVLSAALVAGVLAAACLTVLWLPGSGRRLKGWALVLLGALAQAVVLGLHKELGLIRDRRRSHRPRRKAPGAPDLARLRRLGSLAVAAGGAVFVLAFGLLWEFSGSGYKAGITVLGMAAGAGLELAFFGVYRLWTVRRAEKQAGASAADAGVPPLAGLPEAGDSLVWPAEPDPRQRGV